MRGWNPFKGIAASFSLCLVSALMLCLLTCAQISPAGGGQEGTFDNAVLQAVEADHREASACNRNSIIMHTAADADRLLEMPGELIYPVECGRFRMSTPPVAQSAA